jgi:hypothetical protein
MLTTILVLAAVALYIWFLFRIAFARLWQPMTSAQAPVNNFDSLFPPGVSDPDSQVLWQTQIPVLASLRSGGSQGISLLEAKAWYERLCHRYPELYDGSTFADWLDWLERMEVVQCEQGKIMITEKGSFLEDELRTRRCEVTH